MSTLFALLLIFVSLFLIMLILVQRGRGGGLTGALGGMGGQSAFGTKAGDTFTRITIGAATVWIVLALLAVKLLGGSHGKLGNPASVLETAPATGTAANPLSPETPVLPPSGGAAGTAETTPAPAGEPAANGQSETTGPGGTGGGTSVPPANSGAE